MSFYSDCLFPRYYDRVMKGAPLEHARRRSLRTAAGRILELGIGTGQNLPCYPTSVRSLTAVDPNPGMERELRRKLTRTELEGQPSQVEVEFVRAPAERLPFPDASFDTLVSTQVLCSVDNTQRTLEEALRVLRPGGRLLALEHGHSDEPSVARWQRWLTPAQRLFAAGCRLDVPIAHVIADAGFQIDVLERYYMPGDPKTHGSMYEGIASKPLSLPVRKLFAAAGRPT